MAELNFTKLADAPILEEVPDGAKVYAEVDGKVYRVAGDNLGGGMKTALFFVHQKSANYYYATCQNMTYDKAKAMLMAGEPFTAILCFGGDSPEFDQSKAIWYYSVGDVINVDFADSCVWFPDGTLTNNTDYTPA